jgi:hypothetical protein
MAAPLSSPVRLALESAPPAPYRAWRSHISPSNLLDVTVSARGVLSPLRWYYPYITRTPAAFIGPHLIARESMSAPNQAFEVYRSSLCALSRFRINLASKVRLHSRAADSLNFQTSCPLGQNGKIPMNRLTKAFVPRPRDLTSDSLLEDSSLPERCGLEPRVKFRLGLFAVIRFLLLAIPREYSIFYWIFFYPFIRFVRIDLCRKWSAQRKY